MRGCSPSDTGGGGSAFLMLVANSAEAMKLTASTTIAYGAVTALTSSPASPGPLTWAPARVNSNLVLPSPRWSRETSDGRYDWYETSKNTVSEPTTKPTT